MRVLLAGIGAIGLAMAFLAWTVCAAAPPAATNRSQAGEYCASCHSPTDPRLNEPLAWDAILTPDGLSPCPTVQELRDELLYAGQQVDAIDHGLSDLSSHGESVDALDRQVIAREESLPRILETNYRSADAGVSQARSMELQLGKTYTQIQTARDDWTSHIILAVGIVLTLFLVGSLLWGLANTRGIHEPASRWLRLRPFSILLVIAIFGAFALPIFNAPTPSDTETPAQATRQAALDQVTGSVAAAQDEAAKVWELSLIGNAADSTDARIAFTTAISTSTDLAVDSAALWGRAQSLEESAAAWDGGTDAVPPLVQSLQVAGSRTWSTAALASQLEPRDPGQALELLQNALARTQAESDPYFRSLDLKMVSEAWAPLDSVKARQIADQISDPFVRSWALREHGDYAASAASAREVQDPYFRAYALREIGTDSKNVAILDEALADARSLPEPSRSYALADLAAAWQPFGPSQSLAIAKSIAASDANARADAFGRIGEFTEAWNELAQSPDGFLRSLAEEQLIAEWARVAPADALTRVPTIGDPFLEDEASSALVQAFAQSDPPRALQVAQTLGTPFTRVQALTGIARKTKDASTFQAAAALADQLHDTYPLRDLAVAWAAVEPAKALALVDKMDWEGDRAEALLAVAVALAPSDHAQANSIFDRAVKQAQAARLTGDPVYSAELLRELGVHYASVDGPKADEAFRAAVSAADQVTSAY